MKKYLGLCCQLLYQSGSKSRLNGSGLNVVEPNENMPLLGVLGKRGEALSVFELTEPMDDDALRTIQIFPRPSRGA